MLVLCYLSVYVSASGFCLCISACLSRWSSHSWRCLSVCLSTCLFLYPPACLSVHPPVCPPACLSVYLPVYLRVCLSVCLSVCLPVSAVCPIAFAVLHFLSMSTPACFVGVHSLVLPRTNHMLLVTLSPSPPLPRTPFLHHPLSSPSPFDFHRRIHPRAAPVKAYPLQPPAATTSARAVLLRKTTCEAVATAAAAAAAAPR